MTIEEAAKIVGMSFGAGAIFGAICAGLGTAFLMFAGRQGIKLVDTWRSRKRKGGEAAEGRPGDPNDGGKEDKP